LSAVTVLVFLAMGARMGSLVLDSEVDKLRPAARELRKLCEDYFMSPSDHLLNLKFAKIMKEFPDLSYVIFVDRHGEIHSYGRSDEIDSLGERLAKVGTTEKDVDFIKMRRETYVDITDVTQTVPPLLVHVGFAKSLTDAKTRNFLWNRGAFALVVLAGALVGGFAFLTWLTHPLVDLSTRAERLSLGDMSVRLNLKCGGEIGKVYRSLERLKESTLYALRRLNSREQTSEQQAEQKPPEQEEMAKGEGRWPNLR